MAHARDTNKQVGKRTIHRATDGYTHSLLALTFSHAPIAIDRFPFLLRPHVPHNRNNFSRKIAAATHKNGCGG